MQLDNETLTYIFGILFAASEVLAKVPSVKANSVFEAIQNVLKALSKSGESK
jgi:hypothetical protein